MLKVVLKIQTIKQSKIKYQLTWLIEDFSKYEQNHFVTNKMKTFKANDKNPKKEKITQIYPTKTAIAYIRLQYMDCAVCLAA